jgi:hypothetical protein
VDGVGEGVAEANAARATPGTASPAIPTIMKQKAMIADDCTCIVMHRVCRRTRGGAKASI